LWQAWRNNRAAADLRQMNFANEHGIENWHLGFPFLRATIRF
jgi:hypothetical protein